MEWKGRPVPLESRLVPHAFNHSAMKYCLLVLLFPMIMQAQRIQGEYYMEGLREAACGIRINADSTFEFFYTEGALDRYGKGRWTLADNKLRLGTAPAPKSDFRILSRSANDENRFFLKISEPNKILQTYVTATASAGSKRMALESNGEGEIVFPMRSIDSIELVFMFCPERSTFIYPKPTENYLELGFEPWLFELFFSNLELLVGKDELVGGNPLLTGKTYHYRRTSSN